MLATTHVKDSRLRLRKMMDASYWVPAAGVGSAGADDDDEEDADDAEEEEEEEDDASGVGGAGAV